MQTPLLRYQFSSINNGQITDFGSGVKSTVHGGCTIVSDSVMGSCLNFDGSTGFVSLGAMNFNFSKGITLTCWVNFEKLNNFAHIFDFATSALHSGISLCNQAETDSLVFQNSIQAVPSSTTASKALGINEWLHLAVTVDINGVTTFYIDGIQSATQTNKALCPESVNRTLNFLGKSNTAGNDMFQGKMSWMSMYAEALSSDDILKEMNISLVERGAFRSSLPVDFTLETNHKGTMAPVIFLESAATAETLFLTVKNASSSTLLLSAPTGSTPSNTNFHFQLRFRPGVLSPKFIKNGKVTVKVIGGSASSTWQAAPVLDSSGYACISILSSSKDLPQIKAFGSYQFSIDGVQANPSGGARTTNVEFCYKQLAFSAANGEIQGSRVQHVDIISHVGQKNIPLHVDVVGSSAILNDGKTRNEVLIRLVNTSNKDIDLATSNPASSLQISVDGQPQNSLVEWALSEMDDLQNIQLHWGVVAMTLSSNSTNIPLRKPLVKALPKGTKLNIIAPGSKSGSTTVTLTQDCDQGSVLLPIQANENIIEDSSVTVAIDGQEPWLAPVVESGPSTVNWTIKNGNQTSLKPGDSLLFLLTNIVTGLKSGKANISISYINIPGYWDGQFTIQLEKSPLVNFENKVGIGVNEPATSLDVNGDISVEGHIYQKVSNPGKMGGSLTLENSGSLVNSKVGVFFKTYPTGNCDASSSIIAKDDGHCGNDLLFQFKSSGANTNTLATQVTMNSSGLDVVGTIKGVGMVPPGAVLMQSGSLAGHYDNTGKGIAGTAFSGWAICNGQNGTPNLEDRFIVGAGGDAKANKAGGPDVHTHLSAPPAQAFATTPAGAHTHGMPTAWYNRGLSCGCHTSIDTRSTDVTRDQTTEAGNHAHTVVVGLTPFNSGNSSGLNRPKYYALYFIMRLES